MSNLRLYLDFFIDKKNIEYGNNVGSIFDGGPAPYLCKLPQVMGVMNYRFLGDLEKAYDWDS